MGAFLFPQVDRHLVSSEQTKEPKNTSTNLCILFVPTFYANARIQKNCQIPQDFFYNMLKGKEKNHINAKDLYHHIYSKSGAKNKSTDSRQKKRLHQDKELSRKLLRFFPYPYDGTT